jgi:hypothetical protein
MKALAAVLALMPALFAQPASLSARELLALARPLTPTEIATILDAARAALAGKTLRLSWMGTARGPEVLMGSQGQPKILRYHGGIIGGTVGGITADGSPSAPPTTWREDVTTIIDYTGRLARDCNGAAESREMVIEYELRSSRPTWTVRARRLDARDRSVGIAPVLEMLRGGGGVASDEHKQIGNRRARAFVSAWTPPPDSSAPVARTGDPIPNVVGQPAPNDFIQALWIDTESLLPLRWEVSKRSISTHGFDFQYELIDLRPPAGVEAPKCIG